ncbi:MAG: dockerin type I repeat-containing protein [Clostridia bacterium]|nr:dockerin type I repeat-containing protein [Clostridia bacterium]
MKKLASIFLMLLTAAVICLGAGAASAGRPGDANGDGEIDNKDVAVLFRYVSGYTKGAVAENCDYNKDGKTNNKDVTLLFRDVSSDSIPDSGWLATIEKANALADGVQGKFADAARNKFQITNKNTSIIYDLKTSKSKKVEGIYNIRGKKFFSSMDVSVITSDGKEYKAAESSSNGRMNSNRIGYYYYDFHFRDQTFGSLSSLKFEHTFHTYPDKIHEELRVVATSNYTSGGRLETKTVISANSVRSFIVKNAKGEFTTLDSIDFSSTEYVAFDIKTVGIYGIIMPKLDNNGYIKVEYDGTNYTIRRWINLPALSEGGDLNFGHRIYTSAGHDFDDIRKEAYIERNPLTDISVTKFDDAVYEGYDALKGFYRFSVKAMEFFEAFQESNKNKHMRVKAKIGGDGIYDRTIYVQTAENAATGHGRLECAALLDEKGSLVPVPLEVGKNFDGDIEEQLYAPETGDFSAAYGETYVPITVAKDETKRFTMLHLYQNWGNYPLKQLSFIAFHIPYYHLSLGVTETNCITPYFVYNKDGYMLPDFRANSAPLWDNGTGTQHNSVGRLYFLQYKDASGNSYMTESQSADISSAGPVYADITMDFLSDDGKIKATYRHVEMAQADENRTYYNMRLEVLDDLTINNFRDNFSIFSFDGRIYQFSKIGYLDANNTPQIVSSSTKAGTRYFTLGKEYPYFDYFQGVNKKPDSNDPNNGADDTVNFALIVKRSDITIGGQKYTGNLAFRDKYAYRDKIYSGFYFYINTGSLTLDEPGTVTLKKGDVIDLDIILLPWGYTTSTDDSNVRNVRNDSCVDPYKIKVIEGEPYEDRFVPSVRAVNNTATFKISGGASTAAVRVYGFTKYTAPTVTFKADGKNTDTTLSSPAHKYDGYQVFLDEDGTYSFAFNVDMDKANTYEITVKQ